jgi:hypothetical protein
MGCLKWEGFTTPTTDKSGRFAGYRKEYRGLYLARSQTTPAEPMTSLAIPLLPIWPGLLADTLLFSLLADLIWWGFVTFRRRRLPPGHCPACGYDLHGSKVVCPECGRAIS